MRHKRERDAGGSSIKATRSAVRRGDAVIEPAVDNPEPRKKRRKYGTVIIDHSSDSHTFESRAQQIKLLLSMEAPEVNVVMNNLGRRLGRFVVRPAVGEPFVDLQNLEYPFVELEDINIRHLVNDIIRRL